MDRLEHGRETALGIQIGGGCDAQAAGERGREVGEDVRVQVGGDEGVQRAGLEHHPGRHRVDQLAVGLHLGVVARDLEEDLVPEHHPVPLRVGLGDQREVLLGSLARQLEGEAVDSRHARAGEHGGLGGDLLRQPTVGAPAMAGVLAFADSSLRAARARGGRSRIDRSPGRWAGAAPRERCGREPSGFPRPRRRWHRSRAASRARPRGCSSRARGSSPSSRESSRPRAGSSPRAPPPLAAPAARPRSPPRRFRLRGWLLSGRRAWGRAS